MVFWYRNTPHPVRQLRDEMDRLFSGFLGQLSDRGPRHGQPAVNVWEHEETVMVELEVPGVKADQVDISVVGGELSLKIERPELAQQNVTYHRRERPVGSFTRLLRLPADIDGDQVTAELSDGVLTIALPKAENAKPRKINVATA